MLLCFWRLDILVRILVQHPCNTQKVLWIINVDVDVDVQDVTKK